MMWIAMISFQNGTVTFWDHAIKSYVLPECMHIFSFLSQN